MRQQPAPEPHEVIRECELIRADWSESEHRFRAGLPRRPQVWEPPVVSVLDLPGIEDEETA